jgi:hypothetical protein
MESSNGKQTFTPGSIGSSAPFPPGYCNVSISAFSYLEIRALPISQLPSDLPSSPANRAGRTSSNRDTISAATIRILLAGKKTL